MEQNREQGRSLSWRDGLARPHGCAQGMRLPVILATFPCLRRCGLACCNSALLNAACLRVCLA